MGVDGWVRDKSEISVLFSDADNCEDYVALMIDNGIRVEVWWKDSDGGKRK
jgi:hypothetical protein